MKKRIGIFFLIILLAMPVAFAVSTEVKIKTMPYREVQIGASKVSGESLQSFSNKSDEYGDISFILEFDALKYNLFVFIKEDGISVATKREYNLISGEPVYFEVAIPGLELIDTPTSESKTSLNSSVANETTPSTEDTNITTETEEIATTAEEDLNQTLIEPEENESKISSIAGAAVTKIKENKEIVIYVFVGIILLAGVFMFFHKRKERGGEEKEERQIRVTKLSDKIEQDSKKQVILDMEGKLRQLQDELDKLRG